MPNKERSRRLVQLMGGGAAVLRAAQQAYKADDFQWAAELATLLLDNDASDTQARDIKAAAFRQMGYASININWRNWYLTSAMELEGALEQGWQPWTCGPYSCLPISSRHYQPPPSCTA